MSPITNESASSIETLTLQLLYKKLSYKEFKGYVKGMIFSLLLTDPNSYSDTVMAQTAQIINCYLALTKEPFKEPLQPVVNENFAELTPEQQRAFKAFS